MGFGFDGIREEWGKKMFNQVCDLLTYLSSSVLVTDKVHEDAAHILDQLTGFSIPVGVDARHANATAMDFNVRVSLYKRDFARVYEMIGGCSFGAFDPEFTWSDTPDTKWSDGVIESAREYWKRQERNKQIQDQKVRDAILKYVSDTMAAGGKLVKKRVIEMGFSQSDVYRIWKELESEGKI